MGAERLPVVEPGDRSRIVGFATQARALRVFNRGLIAASVEEHR
jgi:CIC family chloride channel protein